MRIWFDTEFIEDGATIDLISIGMVREDGDYLYLQNSECDLSRASPWVRDNVIPHLSGDIAMMKRRGIAECVKHFAGQKPEFWGYYADYDWVVLCQLFGTMMDLPKGWPMFCLDIKQLCMSRGDPRLPEQGKGEHHALADARWNKAAWEFLMTMPPATLADVPAGERGAYYWNSLIAWRDELRRDFPIYERRRRSLREQSHPGVDDHLASMEVRRKMLKVVEDALALRRLGAARGVGG